MSSPDASGRSTNPYAPPDQQLASVEVVRQPPGRSIVAIWLAASVVLQVILAVFAVQFNNKRILGLPIELPFLHLFVTLFLIFGFAKSLLKRYSVRFAVVVAELFNLAQWSVFVCTVLFMKAARFSTVTLSQHDALIFGMICLGCAVVIGLAAAAVYRRRCSAPPVVST